MKNKIFFQSDMPYNYSKGGHFGGQAWAICKIFLIKEHFFLNSISLPLQSFH
jgi:hypothetical protein